MSCRRIIFFKQKTAYEMRISDWSSDVCSSDLLDAAISGLGRHSQTDRLPHRPRRYPDVGASDEEIGRASCRERVCQYVSISVVAVSLKKKKSNSYTISTLNRHSQALNEKYGTNGARKRNRHQYETCVHT